MAKLSVHGSEIARLHRYVPSPEDPDFAGEAVYFSLRTDGYVLEKRTFHWRDGESNRGSWKLHSKIKAATTAERRNRIPGIFPKLIRNLIGQASPCETVLLCSKSAEGIGGRALSGAAM